MRVGSSSNILIATLRENSFIHAGPLRQTLMRSVYTVYNLCGHHLSVQYSVLCIVFYIFLFCILWASGPEIKLSYLIICL